MESYITFSMGQLQFLDSMQFTNAYLEKSPEELVQTSESFITATQFQLVQQTDVYDYNGSFDSFRDTQLPPNDRYFNKLNDASDSHYKHAQRIWTEFQCETLLDYHDIYLKSDILLLTDFFKKFRDRCMANYG